jgi:hypothetical protein
MAIRALQVTVDTGGDDLRSGSRASVALIGRDLSLRSIDLTTVALNRAGERFADRTATTVTAALVRPIEPTDLEFIELRFVADRGIGNDQWHCERIRVLGNPGDADQIWLWDQIFSRDDLLNERYPTRRSLRLPSFTPGLPQIEVEMTTGGDDLRSDSGGWIELEMADGRLLHRAFSGEFKPGSIHRFVFDMDYPFVDVPPVRGAPLRRARLFYGKAPVGPVVSGLPGEIWLLLTTNDNWDLQRLRVRASHRPTPRAWIPGTGRPGLSWLESSWDLLPWNRPIEYVLVDTDPLRLSRYAIWESEVLVPPALRVSTADRFLVELYTGDDDLRVGARQDITLDLVLRGGGLVRLVTRARADQPFVTSWADGGVWEGSFGNWSVARSVGRVSSGSPVTLADVAAVRLTPVLDVGDRWTLNGIRLSVPFDAGAELHDRAAWRLFASFLNLGVSLDASVRPWQSPAIA